MDAFGVERYDISKREYKARGRLVAPVGNYQGDLGEAEIIAVQHGKTLIRRRPKYEVVGVWPKYKGQVVVRQAKFAREIGDAVHEGFKSGKKPKKIAGLKVNWG